MVPSPACSGRAELPTTSSMNHPPRRVGVRGAACLCVALATSGCISLSVMEPDQPGYVAAAAGAELALAVVSGYAETENGGDFFPATLATLGGLIVVDLLVSVIYKAVP